MLRFSLIFILVLVKPLLASDFRHKKVKENGADYYYIGIGVSLPMKNLTTDLGSFNISISPNSEIGQTLIDNDIDPNSLTTGEQNFSSQKIGASAFLGYKTTSFLRFDVKIDFLTFTNTIQVDEIAFFGFTSSTTEIDFTVRQLAFIGNIYFDLDNPTTFTPYVGAGGGVVFTQATFLMDANGISYQEPNNSLTDQVNFVYELKGGIKIGSRKAYVDFEGFYRNTPGLKLTSVGAAAKVGFRI